MTNEEMKALLIASSGLKAYGIYFFVLMGCSCGFPFNSDILMVIGGALASLNVFDLVTVMILSPIVILLGDMISFNVGRKYGVKILATRVVQKIFPTRRQTRLQGFLQTNARQFVFMIRFMPGIRTIIFVFAGTMQVEPKIFYQMNALSTFLYAPTIIWLSFTTASQLQDASLGQQNYLKWIFILGAIFGFMFLVRHLGKRYWIQEGAK